MSGQCVARTGDRVEARAVVDRIARLQQERTGPRTAPHILRRARITALLDEPDEAMRLLREWYFAGGGFGTWVHADPDFEPLWDHPDFQEFIRPKG